MNTKVLDNYKSFFADQVKEEIEEQKTINRSLIPQLFKKFDELSLAYVDRIQQETGLVILKCPRNMAPRLKVQKALVVIKKRHSMSLGHVQLNGIVNGKIFAKMQPSILQNLL